MNGTGDGNLSLIGRLAELVGRANCRTDDDLVIEFTTDWTARHHGHVAAVVLPESRIETEAVIALCRDLGVAIVAQGGNTGLVGASVVGGRALDPAIIVSTRRLQRLDPVDTIAGAVTVGAGVTLEELAGHVAGSGWRVAVDFGARARATIGGAIATNAGGSLAARFGSMRAQIIGIEAVFGDGTVLDHLHGLRKDNTGYSLAQLLCGSEGTLGIVTAASLALVATPSESVTAVIGFDSLEDAVSAAAAIRGRLVSVEAVEFVDDACVGALLDAGLAMPCDGRHLVMVEAGADTDPTGPLSLLVESLVGVTGVAVATDARARRDLWSIRDAVPEVILRRGRPLKLDVAVPPARLATCLTRLPGVVVTVDPDSHLFRFGHAGDGNIHVNLVGVSDESAMTATVLDLVVSLGGTISAEHGVGVDKTHLLSMMRGPDELAAFARVKRAFDPAGILNPGVIVQAPGH